MTHVTLSDKAAACISALFILIAMQLMGLSFTRDCITRRFVSEGAGKTASAIGNDIAINECQPQVQPHVGHKRVLVSGGAGFIGSHVTEFLLKRGDHVIVVDEMNSYYNVSIKEANLDLLKKTASSFSGRLTIYRGNVGNGTLLSHIFETERPEWVCHMAARAGVRPSIQDPYVYIDSNIVGTTRLMEYAHTYKVKNFILASSSSVYGGSLATVFDESQEVDHPISPYAATKKSVELMAYTHHHLYNLNITALRFFTVYGPRGRPDMAPFKFIDRVSRGEEIPQFGDVSSSRDYTFINDIVDGVVRALDRPHGFQIFNLGKGEGNSLKNFIATVEKHVGKKANINLQPEQPGDVPYTCANVTKAYCLLGYRPKTSLQQGIRQTVEWYRDTYGIRI